MDRNVLVGGLVGAVVAFTLVLVNSRKDDSTEQPQQNLPMLNRNSPIQVRTRNLPDAVRGPMVIKAVNGLPVSPLTSASGDAGR